MITERDTILKAAEVSELLLELSSEETVQELSIPYDDFAYGEALAKWEIDNYNPLSFFSTDDSFLLYYRKELQFKFGLEILTHKEATDRKKVISAPVFIWKTTGFPSISNKLN